MGSIVGFNWEYLSVSPQLLNIKGTVVMNPNVRIVNHVLDCGGYVMGSLISQATYMPDTPIKTTRV